MTSQDNTRARTMIGFVVVEPDRFGCYDIMLGTPLFDPDDRESAEACIEGDAFIAEVYRAGGAA